MGSGGHDERSERKDASTLSEDKAGLLKKDKIGFRRDDKLW